MKQTCAQPAILAVLVILSVITTATMLSRPVQTRGAAPAASAAGGDACSIFKKEDAAAGNALISVELHGKSNPTEAITTLARKVIAQGQVI